MRSPGVPNALGNDIKSAVKAARALHGDVMISSDRSPLGNEQPVEGSHPGSHVQQPSPAPSSLLS